MGLDIKTKKKLSEETAKTMLTMGYPLGDICKIAGLSQEEVEAIGNL